MPENIPENIEEIQQGIEVFREDLTAIRQFLEEDKEPVYQEDFLKTQEFLQEILKRLPEQKKSEEPNPLQEKNAELQTKFLELHTKTSELSAEILVQTNNTNLYMSNLQNIGIAVMVGLGILIGVVCALIFSNYLKH